MEPLKALAQAMVDDERAFAIFLDAVKPQFSAAIARNSTPAHEVDDVTQESSSALWRNRRTLAVANDPVIRSYVMTTVSNKAKTVARRAMQARPCAGSGWYQDLGTGTGTGDDGPGKRERWFENDRWTDKVRYQDGTTGSVPVPADASRRRPRMTPVPVDHAVSTPAEDEQIEELLGRLAMGSHPGAVHCPGCGGMCRHAAVARGGAWWAVASLSEGDDRGLAVLLREGLEFQGVHRFHGRNNLMACCLAVLEHEAGPVKGPQVLQAFDSAIASARNGRSWGRVGRLVAWRERIERR